MCIWSGVPSSRDATPLWRGSKQLLLQRHTAMNTEPDVIALALQLTLTTGKGQRKLTETDQDFT